MRDALDSILPVATLLLGVGLANFLKFSELRRNLRLDAADQLAALPAFLWDTTEADAWLKMNAAVSRLTIRLRLAGVHSDLVERVEVSAIAFWQSLDVVGQGERGDVYSVSQDTHDTWMEVSAAVAGLLSTNSRVKSWWTGREASRLLTKWDAADQALIGSLDEQGS